MHTPRIYEIINIMSVLHPHIDFLYDGEISMQYIDYKPSTDMSNLTVEYLLDIAPCPPAWDPGLLYRIPYPINLTDGEVERIAGRCNVPPRQTTVGDLSVTGNSPDVLLHVLVILSVTSFIILIAAGLICSYKHSKHRTGDSCLQTVPTQQLRRELLEEEMQVRDSNGCFNHTYKSSQPDLQHANHLQNDLHPNKLGTGDKTPIDTRNGVLP